MTSAVSTVRKEGRDIYKRGTEDSKTWKDQTDGTSPRKGPITNEEVERYKHKVHNLEKKEERGENK